MAKSQIKPLIKELTAASSALQGAVETYREFVAERAELVNQYLSTNDMQKLSDLQDQIERYDLLAIGASVKTVQDKVAAFDSVVDRLRQRLIDKQNVSRIKKLNPFRKLNVKKANNALAIADIVRKQAEQLFVSA